jgi:hypothetical protein
MNVFAIFHQATRDPGLEQAPDQKLNARKISKKTFVIAQFVLVQSQR